MIIEQSLLIRFHTAPPEFCFRESCALSCFHGHTNEIYEYFTHWPYRDLLPELAPLIQGEDNLTLICVWRCKLPGVNVL